PFIATSNRFPCGRSSAGHSSVDADVLAGDPCFCNDLSRFPARVLYPRQHLYKLGCRAKNHLSEIRADPRDPWRFLTREAITPEFYGKIGSTLHKIIRFDEKNRRP
ncbi:MAG: hypothetical protein K5636_07300, partial [Bacteroidales bacterium]|nr:hypothetical protein [Bacteroidales bacterium]